MHDNRTDRTRQALLLAAVLLGALALGPNHAHAAPQPTYLYVNPGTNSCGELWHGDEYTDYKPVDPAFVPLHTVPPTDKTRCTAALALMDEAELDYRLKHANTALPDQAQDPCGVLKLALAGGLPLRGKYKSVCEALGHTYVGKVPANAIDLHPKTAGPASGSADDGGICAVTAPGDRRSAEPTDLLGLLVSLLIGR